MSAPILWDLYCCQGGCSEGYARAGFEVWGVDIDPQPRYRHPARFVQADALDVLRNGHPALPAPAAIVASPPCQHASPLRALAPHKSYPALIGPTRTLLNASGLPWVIENVMAADLDAKRSIVLCGGMFGLRTYRHRRFEPSAGLTLAAPAHPAHVARTATSRRRERWAEGWHVSVTGDVGVYVGPAALGIDWMSGDGLSQAIPPAYAEHVGVQLLAQLPSVRKCTPSGPATGKPLGVP